MPCAGVCARLPIDPHLPVAGPTNALAHAHPIDVERRRRRRWRGGPSVHARGSSRAAPAPRMPRAVVMDSAASVRKVCVLLVLARLPVCSRASEDEDAPTYPCWAWCKYDWEQNCRSDLCWGCPECVEFKPAKWWDHKNYYRDRSCLLWGAAEGKDYRGRARRAVLVHASHVHERTHADDCVHTRALLASGARRALCMVARVH